MLPPTLPSPSRGEGGGGGDVTLFIAFILVMVNDHLIDWNIGILEDWNDGFK
jgi:hypothetical protein